MHNMLRDPHMEQSLDLFTATMPYHGKHLYIYIYLFVIIP